jgi:hypothetical protein
MPEQNRILFQQWSTGLLLLIQLEGGLYKVVFAGDVIAWIPTPRSHLGGKIPP